MKTRHPPDLRQRASATALVFSGGGARAAYQVGVLKAILQLHRRHRRRLRQSPFGILTGTSAGAINAAALASGADRFAHAVDALEHIWANMRTEQIYRADSWGVIRTGARWLHLLSLGWAVQRWRRSNPRALLDNSPLLTLLNTHVEMARIPALIERGHLAALAISASSYTSGRHLTFYESAREPLPWQRSQRAILRTGLDALHLLASSAIPFVFPAQLLRVPMQGGAVVEEFFGDGSMRQQAPLAPAIHLGAQRILVVGVGRPSTQSPCPQTPPAAPSLAHIAGHALSSIFLDTLATDIERLQRINHTLSLMDAATAAQTGLHPIALLSITPSQDLDQLAAEHLGSLPPSIRALLGALGTGADVRELGQSALVSYLLFESSYTRALIALGQQDTLARADELAEFLWG